MALQNINAFIMQAIFHLIVYILAAFGAMCILPFIWGFITVLFISVPEEPEPEPKPDFWKHLTNNINTN